MTVRITTADADGLVVRMVEAFGNDDDLNALIAHAQEEFDTATVLLALTCLLCAFIDLYGDLVPGGPEVVIAKLRSQLIYPNEGDLTT